MSDTPSNADANTHYQKGLAEFAKRSRAGTAESIKEFTKVTELEPDFARGHSWLGYAILENYKENWADPQESLRLAKEEIVKGVSVDPDDYYTHWTLASFNMEIKDMGGAHREYEIALALNPDDADLLAGFSDLLSFEGNPSEAIAKIAQAKSLNPNFPEWYQWSLGLAQFQARAYKAAIETFESMSILPNEAYLMLVISKVKEGQPLPDDVTAQLKTMDPDWTAEHLDRMPFAKPEDQDHWQEGLQLTGIQQ